MRSETLLSIRKTRKKYFEEIKAAERVKISPKPKEELNEKKKKKKKIVFPDLFPTRIISVNKMLVDVRNRIQPKGPVRFPNPFKEQLQIISKKIQLFKGQIEEVQEKLFTFLVIFFDAEELLIPQEVSIAGMKVKMRMNQYFQNIKIKSPDILKQQIEKVNQRMLASGKRLRKLWANQVNVSAMHKYPQFVGLFLQTTHNHITSQMRSYFDGTGQRE